MLGARHARGEYRHAAVRFADCRRRSFFRSCAGQCRNVCGAGQGASYRHRPSEINKNVSTTLHITGDARIVLELLLARVSPKSHEQWMWQARSMREEYLSDELFEPRKILRQMAAIAPEMTVATDVGQHQSGRRSIPVLRPRQLHHEPRSGNDGLRLGRGNGRGRQAIPRADRLRWSRATAPSA